MTGQQVKTQWAHSFLVVVAVDILKGKMNNLFLSETAGVFGTVKMLL